MTSTRRWAVVLIGVLVLVSLPYLISRIPAGHSKIPAPTLLSRIQASDDVAFSGYAESSGGLALPVSDSQFGSLADLLGGQTELRVWWRGQEQWRVDTVNASGEDDLHQDANGTWDWDYERNDATRVSSTQPPPARLPRADDLLPGTLARRLLGQATAGEVSRLADRRVAGHDAAGLRLSPDQSGSTIDHVDVWALPSTGLPVQVEVYGHTGPAVVRTSLLDLSTTAPSPSATAFTAPAGANIHAQDQPDLIAAIDRFVRVTPPSTLAGLARAPGLGADTGSVGVYGRGVTLLIALPLPPRIADSLTQQLTGAVSATEDGDATSLSVGPMNVRLTARADNGSRWLLAGTVTATLLATAEHELPVADGFFR